LTRNPSIMGIHANRGVTSAAAFTVAGLIISLNIFLIVQAL
jgi:Mn2+/Fe2+ NRAMP family transporter